MSDDEGIPIPFPPGLLMTNERLRQKVIWEGGITGALEYGIRADAIEDPKTAVMWTDLAAAYEEFTRHRSAMAERLDLSDD